MEGGRGFRATESHSALIIVTRRGCARRGNLRVRRVSERARGEGSLLEKEHQRGLTLRCEKRGASLMVGCVTSARVVEKERERER